MAAVTGGTTTPIVALDFGSYDDAIAMVDRLDASCRFYKVGSELFTAAGPAIVEALQHRGCAVFLDLKFHDIPNTVAGAVRGAASLGARLLTVHASGGESMLRAAVAAAGESAGSGRCEILAVTVLTSLSPTALADAWGRSSVDLDAEVLRLAVLAEAAGVHGIVCSGHEVLSVRGRFGDRLATLVPGVRLAGTGSQDQVRVVTPSEASTFGARYIILGRTVTAAPDPVQAMLSVIADLDRVAGVAVS